MTHYQIITPWFVAGLTEQGDKIVAATGELANYIGQDFGPVRDFARNKGWRIEPIIESTHPNTLEYNGQIFEFHWHDDTLMRITVTDLDDTRDILFDELPRVIKNLL